jgi:hypothetical protein
MHGENSLEGIQEIRSISKKFRIEADVCLTADAVPILNHDLTLDRMCGASTIISEISWPDLPRRLDGDTFVALADLLDEFPDQLFLLDLRTNVHQEFLAESSLTTGDLEPIADQLIESMRKIIPDPSAPNIRFCVTAPAHRDKVLKAFPSFEVDIGEIATRKYLSALPDGPAERILGSGNERMYIRFREIRRDIVRWAHDRQLKLIANHSPSLRSLENSQMMLEKCLEWGLDGLVTSPINQTFIETWQAARR